MCTIFIAVDLKLSFQFRWTLVYFDFKGQFEIGPFSSNLVEIGLDSVRAKIGQCAFQILESEDKILKIPIGCTMSSSPKRQDDKCVVFGMPGYK